MKENWKTVVEFPWVGIAQNEDERNKLIVTINLPTYETSFGEPLPKNTGLIYEPNEKIRFCGLIDFKQPRETKNVLPLIDPTFQTIYESIGGYIKRGVEKIPLVGACGFKSDNDPPIVVTKKWTERVPLNTTILPTEVEFPVKMTVYYWGWVVVHFERPLDPSETLKTLSEIIKFYREQVPTEMSGLFCEYFGNKGFVVEDCVAYLTDGWRGDPEYPVNFYYIPNSLDEWNERELYPVRFRVILPKSDEVVNSFVNALTTCRTVADLCRYVSFFLNMFKNMVTVFRVRKLFHSSELQMWDLVEPWFLRCLVDGQNVRYAPSKSPFVRDDFIDLCVMLDWIKDIVSNPSVTE